MWYVGLDWADTHHDAAVLDEAGKRVGARRFAHSSDGLNELKQFVLSIATDPENLACIVEANHGLLISFLLSAGIPVYPVNPKMANKLRKGAGAKTDQIDAYLLAKMGRFDLDEMRRLEPDTASVQELKTLTRDQDSLVQMQTRLVNQLTACLKEYYPVALELFAKLQQHTTLVFLQTYPTPQAASAASQEQIASVLKQAGHPNPSKAAPAIFATLKLPHLTADAVTTRTKSRLMLALVSQLMPLLEQIAAYDKEITTLFLTHPDHEIFSSLPRAGKRLAPRRLSEVGDDRTRYVDAASLQALAGTSPVLFQSGMYSKAHRRLGCIKPLRNALHQFAWQTTQSEAWAKDYYQRKRMEGKSHTVAIRALSNVWVRIIFAMWTRRECYQTATFELAQQQHARRAA